MVALEAEKWCSDSSVVFAQLFCALIRFLFFIVRVVSLSFIEIESNAYIPFLAIFTVFAGILHDELFRSRDVRFGGLGNSESRDIELEARLWRLLPHVSGAIKWITHE